MNTIETLDSSPFRHLIMTIGELPASYVESMTYYEMLAWLCNYVQTKVIPAVNNNAEAVKEIQQWIETLDLQDEVDHKLDEMAESGELTDIIAGYLNLRGILAYDTIASMKSADNLADGSFAETYGFYAKGDMGGAKYKVRQVNNTDTIDEMSLFALADETLVAELIPQDSMNVKQFGAKGDGVTDETLLLNKIFAYCNDKKVSTIKINEGTYNVSDSVTIYGNCTIEGANKNATTIVMTANSVTQSNHYIFNFTNKSNLTVKNITFKGAKPLDDYTLAENKLYFGLFLINSSNILIDNCGFEQMFASALSIRNTSNVIVINSSFKHNGWNDIALTKTTDNIKIDKNTFSDIIYRSVNAEDGDMNELVTNITITNNSFNTSDTSVNTYAITFGNSTLSGDAHRYQKILISNNIIKNTFYGITYKFVKGLTITNNIFNCGRGIENSYNNMTDYNRDVNISNNTFDINHSQSSTYACEIAKNYNLFFTNNLIKNTKSKGISIYLCNIVFCNNNIIQNTGESAIIANGENVSINNNKIMDAANSAISAECTNLEIKNNIIKNTGSDSVVLRGGGKHYRVSGNYIFNATRYGILFPSGSGGNKFATLQNNQFGEDRAEPVFTNGCAAIGDVDYVVLENTYLLTSGLSLRGSAHWQTHCIFRNNDGFGTLPA